MLGEQVQDARAGASGRAAARHRPSTRKTVLVALAVVVGLVASGTTAVAITGGSLFGLADPPPATAPALTSTPTPTPTPTPTATPSATAPAVPITPVSRIPATCDDLLPQAVAEPLIGAALGAAEKRQFGNPVSYTDERVGALECSWTSGDAVEGSPRPAGVALTIYPAITPQGFLQEAQREGVFIETPEPSIGPDVYSYCGQVFEGLENPNCSFIGLVGDYAISLGAWGDQSVSLDETNWGAVKSLFISLRETVAGFGPPAPLWQPPGATIPGADSCDELLDPGVLAGLLGYESVRIFKREEGEYANAHFDTTNQVGAYWCSWDADTPEGDSVGAAISVLPGGAGYFPGSSAADPSIEWSAAPDYPGEAFSAPVGTPGSSQVTILIDGAWIRVSGPDAAIPGIVETFLANQGVS
jgi:hypothetical protein